MEQGIVLLRGTGLAPNSDEPPESLQRDGGHVAVVIPKERPSEGREICRKGCGSDERCY